MTAAPKTREELIEMAAAAVPVQVVALCDDALPRVTAARVVDAAEEPIRADERARLLAELRDRVAALPGAYLGDNWVRRDKVLGLLDSSTE